MGSCTHVVNLEDLGEGAAKHFYAEGRFSAEFLRYARADLPGHVRLVQEFLGRSKAIVEAECSANLEIAAEDGKKVGCMAEDKERMERYFWAQQQRILASPGDHSLWTQDLVRGPQFRAWSVLWAFAPTVSLVLLRASGQLGTLVNCHLLAHVFFPYWPFSATAYSHFTDTNRIWSLAFFVACTLANAINFIFLLQAARDKWLRIPFLLVVELAIMLLVWAVWALLACALPVPLLAFLARLALLGVPVIRYMTVIQFQDGEYAWLQAICPGCCPVTVKGGRRKGL